MLDWRCLEEAASTRAESRIQTLFNDSFHTAERILWIAVDGALWRGLGRSCSFTPPASFGASSERPWSRPYGAVTVVQPRTKIPPPLDGHSTVLKNDRRWELVQRVISAPAFVRSPLLCRFLLFVVAETLEGRENDITEHQIGVRVFDRPTGYRTVEDNIVRTYARQLRKRLAEYFDGEGRSEEWRIDIPLGGYVPVFTLATEANGYSQKRSLPVTVKIRAEEVALSNESTIAVPRTSKPWQKRLFKGLLFVTYTAALVALTWFATRSQAPQPDTEPAHVLWSALFKGPQNSYIVPSDAGFNLLEDLAHRPIPLADYIQGAYRAVPLNGIDAHSAEDLRSQQLTPFLDSQIAASLGRLPEANPDRVFIRFPRDLRLDDLKNSNAVILGSVSSNPWAAIAENGANFRIVDSAEMKGATIVNVKPEPGEAASYASHWNEPAHETFALIAFRSNLSGTGHLLVLQGLDVAGTQAAAEMLFHPSAIDQILKRATRPDGSLCGFEVLLRATSIESNATGSQVIASRIYLH